MEESSSKETYTLLFDERQERWLVELSSTRRIPLERYSIENLVALYNKIHRGNPLTLMEARIMEQLGEERAELRRTIHDLYDYIDERMEAESDTPAPQATSAPSSGLAAIRSRFANLLGHLIRPFLR